MICVHIVNISAITASLLTKIFECNFLGGLIFVHHIFETKLVYTQIFLGHKSILDQQIFLIQIFLDQQFLNSNFFSHIIQIFWSLIFFVLSYGQIFLGGPEISRFGIFF